MLLPYTYPTPKLSPHRRRCISTPPPPKKKTHTVWFISILNYGDTENVLINHLRLVIPMSYPCHYTNLCPHKPHKHAHTHTHVLLTVLMERYQNRNHYREPSWDLTSILDEWMCHIAMRQAVHSYNNHLSCIHWRTSSCCDGTSVVVFIFNSLHSYSSHVFLPSVWFYLFIYL